MKKILIAVFAFIILAPYGAQGFTVKGEIGSGGAVSHQLANAYGGSTSAALASNMQALEKKVGELEKDRMAQKKLNVEFEESFVSIRGLIKVNTDKIGEIEKRLNNPETGIDAHESRLDGLDTKISEIGTTTNNLKEWKDKAEKKVAVFKWIAIGAVIVLILILIVLWFRTGRRR